MAYVIEKCHYERSDLVAWRETLDEAERYAVENRPKDRDDDWLIVWDLRPDGEVEHVATFEYEPELYRGPLARARIVMRPPTANPLSYIHRTPIDCIRPFNSEDPLYEDRPWRIVATQHCGEDYGDHGGEFFQCHCAGWQDIEGSPEAVAGLVAKYGRLA